MSAFLAKTTPLAFIQLGPPVLAKRYQSLAKIRDVLGV